MCSFICHIKYWLPFSTFSGQTVNEEHTSLGRRSKGRVILLQEPQTASERLMKSKNTAVRSCYESMSISSAFLVYFLSLLICLMLIFPGIWPDYVVLL